MSEKFKKFVDALDALIEDGDSLFMAMQYEHYGKDITEQVESALGKKEAAELIKTLPNFKKEYQAWYSEAQALVKQILPDRFADFQSYYEYPRVRKDITFQNYMIRDYLQGLRITYGWEEKVIADGSAAMPEFEQQINIVKAARKKLDSALIDLTAILQADLFDSEIESAKALAKAGYLRAGGAICGVIIEKHLVQTCQTHAVTVRKKNPGISDLNQLLKDAGTVTVPQWRFIQHLADIRNLCDHAKGREPTKGEIDDLVAGSEKVLKTVF